MHIYARAQKHIQYEQKISFTFGVSKRLASIEIDQLSTSGVAHEPY